MFGIFGGRKVRLVRRWRRRGMSCKYWWETLALGWWDQTSAPGYSTRVVHQGRALNLCTLPCYQCTQWAHTRHKTSAECTNSVHQLTVHHFAHQWFLPVVTPVSPITTHQHHQSNNTCIQSLYPNLHCFKSLFDERHYPHTFFVVIALSCSGLVLTIRLHRIDFKCDPK